MGTRNEQHIGTFAPNAGKAAILPTFSDLRAFWVEAHDLAGARIESDRASPPPGRSQPAESCLSYQKNGISPTMLDRTILGVCSPPLETVL
jgi:hypothetical protein